MQETLRMIFKNQEGRTVAISVPDPDTAITALEVEACMDSVITRNIFTSTGGDLTGKVRAEVVARDVNVLADFTA